MMRVRFRSILAFAVVWLALPAIAFADDCSDWTIGEVGTCPNYVILKGLGLIAGALLSAGAWLGSRWNQTTRELTPEELAEVMRNYHPDDADHEPQPDLSKNKGNFDSQTSAYDPAGTNPGGGPGSSM
jgi:hypothetical protein